MQHINYCVVVVLLLSAVLAVLSFLHLQVLKRLCSQGLSQEIAGLLAECLWVRKEEIRDELVRQSCAISHSYLADYDWKMKVWPCYQIILQYITPLSLSPLSPLFFSLALMKLVLSSDKLSSVQEPLVSLHLDLNEEGEKRSEDIELSKEELGKLISSLDTANKAVLQLRT